MHLLLFVNLLPYAALLMIDALYMAKTQLSSRAFSDRYLNPAIFSHAYGHHQLLPCRAYISHTQVFYPYH
ncbi:hypothetical protein D3C86_1792060 [compost metagenome]